MAYFVTASTSASIEQNTYTSTGSIITQSTYIPNDPINIDLISSIKKSNITVPNLNRPVFKPSITFEYGGGNNQINWLFDTTGSRDLNYNLIKQLNTNYQELAIGSPVNSIQFNDKGVLEGSENFTYLNNNLYFTGSLKMSGPIAQIGNNTITGSLLVSGSTVQTGNNTLIGNTVLSGSFTLSGSATNTIIGNTEVYGEFNVSGSSNFRNSVFIVTGSQFFTGSSFINGSQTITGNQTISGTLDVLENVNVVSGSAFTRWGNKLFNYGQFSSTVTQSGSADTAYSMTFNTTDISNGVSLVSESRITIENTGVYNIQFSSQLHTTANQAVDFSIWFAMTGSNIVNSNTDFSIEKVTGGGFSVAALNFLTQITSGSYVELKYSKTTVEGQLQAKAIQATPTRPLTPSTIVTVTQVA
jgi:hypothetical protein